MKTKQAEVLADVTNKISENEIEVITNKTVEERNVYTYEFLTKQRESILAQQERDNAQRKKEIAEVDKLLAECKKLGIRAKEVTDADTT